MKKLLALSIVCVMTLCSVIPTTFATRDYTAGTDVVYNGQGTAQYTITVPALLAPGASGTVTLEGTWSSDTTVKVTADQTVTLTNSINANDQKVLGVTFNGIEKLGSNTGSQTFTETVSVANIENALFGTWSGKFNYNVSMEEANINNEMPQFSMTHKPSDETMDMTNIFYTNGSDVLDGRGGTDSINYNAGEYYAGIGDEAFLIQEGFHVRNYGTNSIVPMDGKFLGATTGELCEYSMTVTWPEGNKTTCDFAIVPMNIDGAEIQVPTITYYKYDSDGVLYNKTEAHSLWLYNASTKTYTLATEDTIISANMQFYVDCNDVFLDTLINNI